MDVEVDLVRRTGHGICALVADGVFEVKDHGSVLIDHEPAADQVTLSQAVTLCPAAALRLLP